MNFAPKCTSQLPTQTPLDSSLDAAAEISSRCRLPRVSLHLANPHLPALEVNSTRKGSSKPVKLKRLTKRVVIKADGRYLIYYEKI